MTVVGICGYANAGKSTAANYLVDTYGFTRLSFASALKDVCAALFHWDRTRLEGLTPRDREWREVPDEFWSRVLERRWTPRIALQYVGTEVMRNSLHKDIWVNRVAAQLHSLGPDAKVVFDDARFLNELETIRAFGGSLVVVGRTYPSQEHIQLWNAAFGDGPALTTITSHLHPSETEWLTDPTIRTSPMIWNNDDLDSFYMKLDKWYASVSKENS